MRTAACLLFGLAFAAAVQASASPEDIKAAVLSNPVSVHRGEREFGRTCAMCHGSGGTGGVGKRLADRHLMPDYIFQTITNGLRRGASFMPSFGQKLSVEVRWELVAYIMSLGSGRQGGD
jgi:mono/diheme cytochrome c family protein